MDNRKLMNVELTEEARLVKIKEASDAYSKFMDVIMPDWKNDSHSLETPNRVAKMYVNDILGGVYNPPPKTKSFDNGSEYSGMVCQTGIKVTSICAHHHQPIFGKAVVAYIPKASGTVIGLSKLNRIVHYCSRRFQVQEALTQNILDSVTEAVGDNDGVAVYIEAMHGCVQFRGVEEDSVMKTCKLTGLFFRSDLGTRSEFLSYVNSMKR